jgi:hypothetical protein
MKDYSELKGLPMKMINHEEGANFEDCFVAEIDDCGLTILGYCTNSIIHERETQVKIYCLRNEFPEHLVEFPVAVKMILTGTLDWNELRKFRQSLDIVHMTNPFGSQPTCAFE